MLRPLDPAHVVQVDESHHLLVTEAGRDGRMGLTACIGFGNDGGILGLARVALAAAESRSSAAKTWAALDGCSLDAIQAALLQAAGEVEVLVREQERAAKGKPAEDKAQGRALKLEDPEPWPEPVNGAELLADIAALFERHLVLPDGAAEVIALWVAHCYAFEHFDHTGYLALCSPEKRCGKSSTLTLVRALARRALSADDATPAALFRTIEEAAPTLLIDEVDRIPADSDVWGILNSGHARGGQVLRVVGESLEPRAFGTYCPKVVAYIRGSKSPVPDTLEDRSIRVMLQRKRRGEPREKIRTRALEEVAAPLRRRLMRFAEDPAQRFGATLPEVPDDLDDRAADCWEPLLAVAEAAGGGWPRRAWDLALHFAAERVLDDEERPGVLLLSDLAELIESGSLVPDSWGLAGDEMVRLLRELPDRPWRTWGRKGDGLSPAGLARLLKPFGLRPDLAGPKYVRVKRYAVAAISETAARFEGVRGLVPSATTLSPSHPAKPEPVSDSLQSGERVRASDPLTQGGKGSPTLSPFEPTRAPEQAGLFGGEDL